MTNAQTPPPVLAVRSMASRTVWLSYADGTAGEVDLAPLLRGQVFERVRDDDDLFARVFVDAAGALAWPDGSDVAPEVLHDLAVAQLRQPEA